MHYKVALCILTGSIIWINGPYECGLWSDISIFRNSLKSHLAPNERVEADDGYVGEHPQCCKSPVAPQIWKRLNTCSNTFVTGRSPSTIASSSKVVWHKTFGMRFHDIETGFSVLLCLSSKQSMLAKSSLTVDTEIQHTTLESLIVAMFLQANTRHHCIPSWN